MLVESIINLLEAPISQDRSFRDMIVQLIQYMGNITRTFEMNEIHEDDRNKYMKRMLSRWFAQNYSNIKSYARSLQFKGSAIRSIADIPVFIQTYDSTPFSKGDGMKVLLANLPQALKEIGMSDLSKQFEVMYDRLTTAALKSKSKPTVSQPSRPEVKDQKLRSEQQSQVEEIINNELAKISDPQIRHQARLFISKSANKLQALHQFLARYR